MSCDEDYPESDSDDNNTTGEEKCIFDEGLSVIVGSLMIWPPESTTRSVPQTENFEEIPTQEYLNNISGFDWLDTARKHVYCLIRAIKLVKKAESTGIRLSPNFIGTARHSSELSGGLYPFNSDAVVRGFLDLSKYKDWVFIKKLIDTSLYSSLTGSPTEFINFQQKIKTDTSFDFSIVGAQNLNVLPNVDSVPFIIPSSKVLQQEDNIFIMGYPQLITQKKLDACYGKGEAKPKTNDINEFFAAGWKTASLGKVKYSNGSHAIITAASCIGMSGSPVFTFEGELVGFLIGSKPGCSFNIVILVSHPTFVVEYCKYCGNELLAINSEVFGPQLVPFVSKHWETLEKASHLIDIPEIENFTNTMKKYLDKK